MATMLNIIKVEFAAITEICISASVEIPSTCTSVMAILQCSNNHSSMDFLQWAEPTFEVLESLFWITS